MRDEAAESKERQFLEYWSRYGGLVMRVIRRCSPTVDEDLVQVGRLALWEAMITYDGTRGMKFSSWLWRIVMKRVLEWRAVAGYPLALPYNVVSSGKIPQLTVVSISHSDYDDSKSEEDAEESQIGVDEPGYSRVCDEVDLSILVDRLRHLLTPRQWHCVCRYFGLLDGDPMTLDSIASELGITRQAVHFNLQGAFDRIRKDVWFSSRYHGTV